MNEFFQTTLAYVPHLMVGAAIYAMYLILRTKFRKFVADSKTQRAASEAAAVQESLNARMRVEQMDTTVTARPDDSRTDVRVNHFNDVVRRDEDHVQAAWEISRPKDVEVRMR